MAVPKQTRDESLIQIEATQSALRESIAQAKELAEESERLVRRHRNEFVEPDPETPPEPAPDPSP